MKRLIGLFILFLLFVNISCARKHFEIKSPSRNLVAKIAMEDSCLKLTPFDSSIPLVTANLGRFVFDNNESWNAYHIKGVKQTFKDEEWVTEKAQGTYKKENISVINIACERPLVIRKNDTSFLALGEAALVDFARMKFIKDPANPLSLQVTLDGDVDLEKAGYTTPWRYIMVDVHDEYRPTGYSRSYPNFMTQEGIRGDEESPSTEHTLITLFTRMIAGAGDNTNCYFAPRIPEKMGEKAAQMAKAVMLYSPWQFLYWYDRPQGSPHKKGGAGSSAGIIQENKELQFFDAIPTVWDDTKVLEGKIGEYATIVRKSEDTWFVGTLTSGQPRRIEISLTFLDKEEDYEAVIYYQNVEDLETNQVRVESIYANQKTVLSRDLLENSGLAVIINKK